MGVLNNPKKVFFSPISAGETTATSSEDEGAPPPVPQPPIQAPRRPRPPPSPATSRKLPLAGTSLRLKKGRRARRRYDSERSLFDFAGIDPDEAPDGWDIAQENTSNFRSLLDDHELLDQFLNHPDESDEEEETDNAGFKKNSISFEDQRDPETSFLRISCHLRQALKKHLAWGMLTYLEEQIIEHFKTKPTENFIASELSSYERLLAHVCSMYNNLNSQSFDENGVRKLKIMNPAGSKFQPIDPNLCQYLRARNHTE